MKKLGLTFCMACVILSVNITGLVIYGSEPDQLILSAITTVTCGLVIIGGLTKI